MLKLGVIGAGGRGLISQLAHQPEKGVQLTAICDTRESVIASYRQTIHPEPAAFSDYRQLLDESGVDAVFITTPDYLHEEMAVAALERHIAVYLEKPLAVTLEGCDHILAAARRNNCKLYVGHNMRFFPVIRKMKQLIDAGRIGSVQAIWCRHFIEYGGDAYFKDWHSERRNTTGLLLQKGAHDIDVIHYLAGAYTVRTVGMGKLSVYNQVKDRRSPDERGDATFTKIWPPLSQRGLSPVIDVEDHSMVFMELANGVQASYQQCHYTPDTTRNYTIIGTEGRLENFGDAPSAEFYPTIHLWNKRCGYQDHGLESFRVMPESDSGHGGADAKIVDDFINYLKTGVLTGATPIDARQAVAVGYLATQSLRNGNQPMNVPMWDESAFDCRTAEHDVKVS